MLMTEISAAELPVGEDAVVFLAERLGAVRALDDTESRVLQRALTRSAGGVRRWTASDDASLLKMHKARIRGAEMAATLRRSENSVYTRLRDLKKRERVR